MFQDLLYHSLDYFLLDVEGRERRFSTVVMGTPDTIGQIMALRNMGEVFELTGPQPYKRSPANKSLADMIESEGFTSDALHMACFVGFVALKSGAASIEAVLGDVGLVHEIAHNIVMGEGEPCIASRSQIVRMGPQD